MKKFILFWLLTLHLSFSSTAQIKKPLYSPFQVDVEHIIMDYPNSFHKYIGDVLEVNPQSTDYSSLLKVSGSEECRITKYPSQKRDFYSFQAVLLTTDNFQTAKRNFIAFYAELSGLSMHVANKLLLLKGNYESPEDTKKFTSVMFSTNDNDYFSKHLKVELLLEYALLEWKIKVLIYEKEREDDEEPLEKEYDGRVF